MGNYTISDISASVVLIVGLISGIGYLHKSLKKYIKKILEDQFKGINTKLDDVESKLDKVDLETCKNFLVRCLADFEKGVTLSEVEKERFWEQYQHYKDNGGNTYIVEWTERLKRNGKI